MKPATKFFTGYHPAEKSASQNVADVICDTGASVTIPAISALDGVPIVEVESNDFDPYNSGSFDWSKFKSNE